MSLESIIGKTKNFGRKFLMGALAASVISLGSCNKVNVTTPDDITIDPKHVGMVEGRTVSARISTGNTIAFSGYSGVGVKLYNSNSEPTDFKTTSVSGGVYAMDNIPTGSYNVRGCGSFFICDDEPAIVSSQQSYKVNDLVVTTDKTPNKQGIVYGKVKRVDGSLYTNKTIELWKANITKEASTITSSDGSYAFYFLGSNYYLKSSEGNLQFGNWTPIGYFDPQAILSREGENVKGPLINQDVTFIPP